MGFICKNGSGVFYFAAVFLVYMGILFGWGN